MNSETLFIVTMLLGFISIGMSIEMYRSRYAKKKELLELRDELKAYIDNIRTELKAYTDQYIAELREDREAVWNKIDDLHNWVWDLKNK